MSCLPSLCLCLLEFWPAKDLRRVFSGPPSTVGLSNQINISTMTLMKSEEKAMSWDTSRWKKQKKKNQIFMNPCGSTDWFWEKHTWYRCSWRMRGQERAWLRCIDTTTGPAWAEVSSAAIACRSRNASPPCWIWPCLARMSSLARACCKARESWLAGGPCQRESTFKGKIWESKGNRNRSAWQRVDSIAWVDKTEESFVKRQN